jgi:hypothetical protein
MTNGMGYGDKAMTPFGEQLMDMSILIVIT